MATEPHVRRGNLEYQRKQAKELRRAFHDGDPQARLRAFDVLGDRAEQRFALSDAQHVLAVEHGCHNWAEFRAELAEGDGSTEGSARSVFRLDTLGRQDVADFEARAKDLRADFARGDSAAARRVEAHLRRENGDEPVSGEKISLNEARLVIALEYGYQSFPDLAADVLRVRQELIRPTEPSEAQAIRLIRTGDAAGLRDLLGREPELAHIRSSCRETLLGMVAEPEAFGVRLGRELGVSRDVVGVLVEAGSELEGPLNIAASHNRVELVRLLLEAGADRHARDKTYCITPLQAAIYHGAAEAADLLAEGRISPDAFYVAAGAGRLDLLPRWFRRGELAPEAMAQRPNLADVGWSPRPPAVDDPAEVLGEAFALACYNGRIEAAQWLLDHGADVDAHPYLDLTGLHFAVLGGHRAMVKWLLDRGADPTLRDAEHHTTPASWARFVARKNTDGPAILGLLEQRTEST